MDYRSIAGNRLAVKSTDWKPAGTGIILPNRSDPIKDKMANDISTSDLLDTHTNRRNQRAKVYERVYRKCCSRIRHANDILYAKECVFTVPPFQLWGGVPLYQVNPVVAYIMLRLKQKGFDVKYLPPDSIGISWQKAVSGDSQLKYEVANTVRFELDEVGTAGPKLDHEATSRERMLHEGCKGECCVNGNPDGPRRVTTRKQQLELERRKQQIEIDRLIASKDKAIRR